MIAFITSGLSHKQLKAVLQTLTNDQVKALGEVALNTLYSILPLSTSQKAALKKYSSKIDFISDKRNSVSKRKEVIATNPKLIEQLLKAVKPALSSLLP